MPELADSTMDAVSSVTEGVDKLAARPSKEKAGVENEKVKAYVAKATAGGENSDPEGYYKVFTEFDVDGSGAVDTEEVAAMIESLGMVLKKEELDAMIKMADEDGSGEIEFDEFVLMMVNAATQGAETKGGQSFASIIKKKANSVPCNWRTDRSGAGIEIIESVDADGKGSGKKDTARYTGTAPAVAALDPWMPGDTGCNKGMAVFEVDLSGGGDVWLGLIGKNYNPEGYARRHRSTESAPSLTLRRANAAHPKTARGDPLAHAPSHPLPGSEHWNLAFFDKNNQKRNLAVACQASDGKLVNGVQPQGTDPDTVRGKQGAISRIQISYAKDDKEASFVILEKTKGGWEPKQSCETTVSEMKHEMGFAVCFTGVPEGKAVTVRLVGSSCEKVEKRTRRSSKDLWDEDSQMGLNTATTGSGVGAAELNT